MSRYVVKGSIQGSLSGWVGYPKTIGKLPGAVQPFQIDLTLSDTSADPVEVRVGVDPDWVALTIPATTRFLSTPVADLAWAVGSDLAVEVTSATAFQAMNLDVQVYVDEAGALPGVGAGLVTLSELKARLGITSATPEEDAQLQAWIDMASSRIRAYCHQWITPAVYQETLLAPYVVHLGGVPVRSITSISRDDQALDPDTEVRFSTRSGRLFRIDAGGTHHDWHHTRRLEITYEAGYPTTPPEIKECIYIGIGKRWEQWSANRGLGNVQQPERETVQDIGTVTHGGLTAGDLLTATYRDDFLLGFPLAMLNLYVDHSHSFHQAEIYEVTGL